MLFKFRQLSIAQIAIIKAMSGEMKAWKNRFSVRSSISERESGAGGLNPRKLRIWERVVMRTGKKEHVGVMNDRQTDR